MIGVLNHEMYIERQFRILSDKIDNCRAEGNIIDEMPVHDVAVDPVGTGFLDVPDFISQSRKIGGENGRRDDDLVQRHAAENVERSTCNVQ